MNYRADSVNYYVNGVKQADPTISDTEPLGEDVQITNTATVSGGGIGTPVTADAVITHSDSINLATAKTLDPAVVPENGTITYTFNIQ